MNPNYPTGIPRPFPVLSSSGVEDETPQETNRARGVWGQGMVEE